jgi:AhpD family alkylhydroperoxidase
MQSSNNNDGGDSTKPGAKPWPMDTLSGTAPQIGRAFGPFFQALMKGGALSVKQKELIAVGIAVAVHCEPCVNAHVEKCLKAEATEAEIMEAAGVGVVMGGGPAYMYSALVAAALTRLEGSPTQ